MYSSGTHGELVTPTGALILSSYASEFGPVPAMKVRQVGYGAGDRDPADTPNVLRVMVGESAATHATEQIVVIECEIDDMNPQIFGAVMERLYDGGALEVYFAPVQMKKNRPGTLLTILSEPTKQQDMLGIVFRETTTIGARYHTVTRERLSRKTVSIETPLGPVRFKLATYEGEVVNASPEFDDCQRIASERGVAVKEVQTVALKAYMDRNPPRS